jgi:tRNA pseudouridine32 synthase/23S rRNA pseudouridine746 synthase
MPVVGDRLHGRADENEIKNLQLSAVSLSFTCPLSGNKQYFELKDEMKLDFTTNA